MSWFGQALAVATAYNMPVAGQSLMHLARVMASMGEQAFTVAWCQAFPDQDPLLNVPREILESLDREND